MVFVLLRSSLRLSQTFNCGSAVGGAVGPARHPAAVSWETGSQGQILIFSPGDAGPHQTVTSSS